MSKIALITDSTSDLPEEYLSKHDIKIVPLYVTWGSDELVDGVDITPSEFYKRLPEDPNAPKTSQPTPGDFINAVKEAQEKGAEEVVIVTISSGLSGTYSSASQAAEAVDIPVHVFDSKTTSMGLGWQVLGAARARENGGDAQAMLAAAERVRSSMVVKLYVDTLEYLHRGGRIGGASKLIGTALNIKPLLYVDHVKGTVEAGGRTRTRKRALDMLYKSFLEEVDTSKPLHVGITNGNSPEDTEAMANRLRSDFPDLEMVISFTSPVIGTHTGPGSLALCGYGGD